MFILIFFQAFFKYLGGNMSLINEELEDLEEENIHQQNTEAKVSWREMFTKRAYFRALIATSGLQIIQELSGIFCCR